MAFPIIIFPWQSIFFLEQLEMAAASGSRYLEQIHGDRRGLPHFPSSWDHQLGLALRSRWDIEIPDCP